MPRLFTATVFSVAIGTAPVTPLTAQSLTQPAQTAPVVPADWSLETDRGDPIVAEAVKQTVAEIKSHEDAEASATRYDTYNVYRHRQNGQQKFELMFIDSKVPGCLRPDGLKRQSTLIFGGLLAIPFIAVAALRGKCN
ncbi:MAG: hypothetical protein V4723_05260 [Pseudomonadota bacterium]